MANQRIKANLIPSCDIYPVIHLAQYDMSDGTGKQVEIELYYGTDKFTIPSGASVTFRGTKRDKTGYSYAIEKFTDNVVTVDVKPQMTVLSGKHNAELRISKGETISNTIKFVMDIDSSALADDTKVSETDLSVIEKALQASDSVIQAKAEVEQLKESVEASEKNAKLSETNASSASASSSRSAQASAESASSASQSATNAQTSAESASTSATTASTKATEAQTSAESAIQTKAEIEQLKKETIEQASTLTESAKQEISTVKDATVTEVTKLKNSTVSEITTLKDSTIEAVTLLKDNAKAEADRAKESSESAKVQAEKAQASADSIANVTSDVDKLKENVSAITPRLEVVEKQVANTNLDNLDLRNIILDVDSGLAKAKYPIGTQLIFDWNRVNGNGNKTLYNPAMNITHYETATVKDSDSDAEREANVMYLEWDKTIPDGFPFCIQQALQCFDGTEGTPNGLPKGTYCIKMVAKNGGQTFRNRWDGKYATFTLTKDIPQGGTLRLTINTWDGDDTSKLGLIFRTYASFNQNDAVIETFTANEPSDTQPSDAIFMGKVWGEDVGYGKINHPESCYYGDNTWAHCDLRQWLNGEGTDWWTKQTRYHIKPNIVNSLQGYLTGLDENLKKNIVKIKNTTIGNNMKYKDVRFETYDTIFLASFNQRNITTDLRQQFDNEGKVWDYYKQLASGVDNLNNGMFKIWQTYPVLIRYAINAPTSPQFDFSRSAHLGNAYNVHIVHASGSCSNTHAGHGNRCRPACVIAKKNRTTEVGA